MRQACAISWYTFNTCTPGAILLEDEEPVTGVHRANVSDNATTTSCNGILGPRLYFNDTPKATFFPHRTPIPANYQ